MRRLIIFVVLIASNIAFAAAPIQRLYVFGDSYSDYGRASSNKDGPTSVVYMAQRLGFELAPYKGPGATDKSLNFATGGAKTGDDPGHPIGGGQVAAVGLKVQVSEFERGVRSGEIHFDPRSTLFFIAGGLNDRTVPTQETLDNLEQEVGSLYALGGRRFRIAILPEMIPRFAPVGKRLNPGLRALPATLKKRYKDIEVENSEWGKYFDMVLEDAARYGFSNSLDQCFVPATKDVPAAICEAPASHFYYQVNHPSTAVHKIVGEMLFKDLAKNP